jgi:hypothetical protein
MIYGGTKYSEELRKLSVIFALVGELERKGRTVVLPGAEVDRIAAELKVQFPENAFNDEHIVAIVIASRCRVVCTLDRGAMSYLRSNAVFTPYKVKRPSIYSGSTAHHKLCCDKHVVEVCRASQEA